MAYTGWSLKEMANRFRAGIPTYEEIEQAMGNIRTPLFDMPLKNTIEPSHGIGAYSYQRATTATLINRYGYVATYATHVPRHEKKGLLVEGASTNISPWSEAFAGHWVVDGMTAFDSSTTAPDQTGTGVFLLPTVVDQEHSVRYGFTSVTGEYSTCSLFVKDKGDAGFDQVRIQGVNLAYGIFDVSTGDWASTPTAAYYGFEVLADGWYRIWISDLEGTGGAETFRINVLKDGLLSYPSDGTSGLYVWGAQVEQLPFATSYIPTAGTTVTRGADVFTVSFMENQPRYYEVLSMLVDMSTLGEIHTLTRTALATSNGLVDGYIDNQTNGQVGYSLAGGTTTQTKADWSATTRYAFTSNASTYSVFENSVLKASGFAVGGTRNAIPTSITIGCAGGGALFLYGHISNIRIYDRELTTTEMRMA